MLKTLQKEKNVKNKVQIDLKKNQLEILEIENMAL